MKLTNIRSILIRDFIDVDLKSAIRFGLILAFSSFISDLIVDGPSDSFTTKTVIFTLISNVILSTTIGTSRIKREMEKTLPGTEVERLIAVVIYSMMVSLLYLLAFKYLYHSTGAVLSFFSLILLVKAVRFEKNDTPDQKFNQVVILMIIFVAAAIILGVLSFNMLSQLIVCIIALLITIYYNHRYFNNGV